MKNTMKASDFIRVNWDWKGTSTQSFEIDGKIIKTNAYGKDVYWNGNDIPEKYTRALGGINYKANHGRWQELEECINAGYDEIRFVLLASGMIRGYCTLYVWASNSQKAKEARAKMRAEEKAKSQQAHELAQKISQMDAGEVCEMVENALEEIKAEEAQELTEAPAKEITPNEPEKATEGNSEAQDDAQEMKEMEERMNHLGCRECFHLPEGSSVCDMIIRRGDAFKYCPYYYKKFVRGKEVSKVLSGKNLEDIIKELKKLEEDLANLRHEITQRIMNGERLNSKEENK